MLKDVPSARWGAGAGRAGRAGARPPSRASRRPIDRPWLQGIPEYGQEAVDLKVRRSPFNPEYTFTTWMTYIKLHQIISTRASLVAQWLRICLPMQGTRVRALVWEDPTCHGATRPVSHNY